MPQAVHETVYHSVGDCTAYDDARKECFSFISSKVPSFGALSQNKKVDFLLSDDNPVSVDASIYRFYIHYFYNVLSWLNRLGQEKRLWFRNPVIIYYYYYYYRR